MSGFQEVLSENLIGFVRPSLLTISCDEYYCTIRKDCKQKSDTVRGYDHGGAAGLFMVLRISQPRSFMSQGM
jgi:hypothetical protein